MLLVSRSCILYPKFSWIFRQQQETYYIHRKVIKTVACQLFIQLKEPHFLCFRNFSTKKHKQQRFLSKMSSSLSASSKSEVKNINSALSGCCNDTGKVVAAGNKIKAKIKKTESDAEDTLENPLEEINSDLFADAATVDDDPTQIQDSLRKRKSKVRKEKKEEKKKVNHFLAIRINNADIHKKVKELQQHLELNGSLFKPAFIPVPTLHITLNTLSLSSNEDKKRALTALELSLDDMREITEKYENRTLEFSGLNDFNDKVLFIDVIQNSCYKYLNEITELFYKHFHENDVFCKKDHKFRAHLTVMKLSRCIKKMRRQKIKEIPNSLYEESKNDYFGTESVNEILLCSMTDKKTSDGFYKILGNLDLVTFTVDRNADLVSSDMESSECENTETKAETETGE